MSAQKKILVIEDDTFLLDLLSKNFFGHAGILVIGAHNGLDGLAAVKMDRPDLILLDLMLPDVPGAEVMRRLKEDDATKSIPVIIFSNLGAREEIEKELKAGALAYLVKSNTFPGDLVGVVTEALGMGSSTA